MTLRRKAKTPSKTEKGKGAKKAPTPVKRTRNL
jgi:hypothetical protein